MSGRVPAAPGSHASHGAATASPPIGFDPSRRLEFRPDENGEFDEIVARFADGMVHVETMSDTGCYVGFYWDDGRYCQWWITSKKKLKYSHEDGQGKPPRFTAWGTDRRDSDGSRMAETPEEAARGEAEPARAAEGGIAQDQALNQDSSNG